MTKSIVRKFIFSVALIVALSSASGPGLGAPRPPYDIYAIVSETGSAAFLGAEEARALTIIEALANKGGGIHGTPIHFVIEDDHSSPQIAVQLMSDVISKQVPIVLGSSVVSTCQAMASLAAAKGPVTYCFTPGVRPELDPARQHYIFSSSISTGDMLKASARYFHDVGWTKIGVITSTDATGQDADRSVDAAFDAATGIQIVDREHFNLTDISVSAQVAKMKAAGAEAIIAWTTGTPAATVLRALNDVGADVPLLLGNGNLTYAQMKAYGPYLSKKVYFAAPPSIAPGQLPDRNVKATIANFRAAFAPSGLRPDYSHALAWDPAMIVLSALRSLGLNASAEQVAAYIDHLSDFAGVDGRYDFQKLPQRGVGVDSAIIVRWSAEKNDWLPVSAMGGAVLKK